MKGKGRRWLALLTAAVLITGSAWAPQGTKDAYAYADSAGATCGCIAAKLPRGEDGFAGGYGTEGSPYEIRTAAQLSHVRSHLNGKYFVLMNDIDLTAYCSTEESNPARLAAGGMGWQPIGGDGASRAANWFTGSFDGQGYVISNMTIRAEAKNSGWNQTYGLFGNANGGAKIRNLVMENPQITIKGNGNNFDAGTILGYNKTSAVTIDTIAVLGGSITAVGTNSQQLGGIFGTNQNNMAAIRNCYADVRIFSDGTTANTVIGGIGAGYGVLVLDDNFFTGSIEVASERPLVGGIAGRSNASVANGWYNADRVTPQGGSGSGAKLGTGVHGYELALGQIPAEMEGDWQSLSGLLPVPKALLEQAGAASLLDQAAFQWDSSLPLPYDSDLLLAAESYTGMTIEWTSQDSGAIELVKNGAKSYTAIAGTAGEGGETVLTGVMEEGGTEIQSQEITVEVPEAPGASETPPVPEAPGVPEVPETAAPSVPVVPETPAVPEAPGAPETPSVPETPGVPETPEAPEVPEAPGVPETPAAPEVPEVPAAPEVPQVKGCGHSAAAALDGKGTAADPFRIETAAQLDHVREHLSSSYLLANDIDLAEYCTTEESNPARTAAGGMGWRPIGGNGTSRSANFFTGSFDGQGYVISNMTIQAEAKNSGWNQTYGLFGNAKGGAKIRNLVMKNPQITIKGNGNNLDAGTILGFNNSSAVTIEAIAVLGGSITVSGTGGQQLGGILGCSDQHDGATIRNCYAEVKITSNGTTANTVIGGIGGGGPGRLILQNNLFTGGIETESKLPLVDGLAGRANASVTNGWYNRDQVTPQGGSSSAAKLGTGMHGYELATKQLPAGMEEDWQSLPGLLPVPKALLAQDTAAGLLDQAALKWNSSPLLYESAVTLAAQSYTGMTIEWTSQDSAVIELERKGTEDYKAYAGGASIGKETVLTGIQKNGAVEIQRQAIAVKVQKVLGKETHYRITVRTGAPLFGNRRVDRYQKSDYDIKLALVGENGVGEWMTINPYDHSAAPLSGQVDVYDVSLKDVGAFKGIQYYSQLSNPMVDWYIDWIQIDQLDGNSGAAEDSNTVSIRNYVVNPQVNTETSSYRYDFTVKTGSPMGAGTDSNIYVRLIGSDGEMTEEREISELVKGNAFERNRTDICSVYFDKSIGTISGLQIRSDCSWAGSDWFVDSIRVDKYGKAGSTVSASFPLNQWIADTSPKTFRSGSAGAAAQYRIAVKTGNSLGAGTDSNIYVRLTGDKGTTEEREISELVTGNAFEKGAADTVVATFDKNVGNIKKLELRSDMSWAGGDWQVDSISVTPVSGGAEGQEAVFSIGQWITDTSWKTFSNDPADSTQYRFTVKTGTAQGAGTDSNIYVRLIGSKGTSNEIEISELVSGNAFENGKTDVFMASFDKNVGDIQKLQLRSDMSWAGADWLPSSVQIEPVYRNQVQSGGKTFQINQWIQDKNTLSFSVDGKSITQYKFTVKTGKLSWFPKGEGTDSNIYVKLVGDRGTTNEVEISELVSGNAFERGNTDTCNAVFQNDIGTLQKIQVHSDMSWAGADWYVEYIQVQPLLNGQPYGSAKTFSFNQWITNTSVYERQ